MLPVHDEKVIGLSKLARVVDVVSRRPQVQERMTEEIANLLLAELNARGVGVVIEAAHTCMTIRGVKKPGSLCVTSAMKGIFRKNLSKIENTKDELYPTQSTTTATATRGTIAIATTQFGSRTRVTTCITSITNSVQQ